MGITLNFALPRHIVLEHVAYASFPADACGH
jgi:hypothetical protein